MTEHAAFLVGRDLVRISPQGLFATRPDWSPVWIVQHASTEYEAKIYRQHRHMAEEVGRAPSAERCSPALDSTHIVIKADPERLEDELKERAQPNRLALINFRDFASQHVLQSKVLPQKPSYVKVSLILSCEGS